MPCIIHDYLRKISKVFVMSSYISSTVFPNSIIHILEIIRSIPIHIIYPSHCSRSVSNKIILPIIQQHSGMLKQIHDVIYLALWNCICQICISCITTIFKLNISRYMEKLFNLIQIQPSVDISEIKFSKVSYVIYTGTSCIYYNSS